LKPPQTHQIKGQAAPKLRHSSLARPSILSLHALTRNSCNPSCLIRPFDRCTPGCSIVRRLTGLNGLPTPRADGGEAKPRMPGDMPTNRHKPMPIDFGPVSGCFAHDPKLLQAGFCRLKHRHRNADPEIGPGGGRKPDQKPQKNYQITQKPDETQGPCPDLKGFCISALTVNCEIAQPSCWGTSKAQLGSKMVTAEPEQSWNQVGPKQALPLAG
jgi:hypothetical protein